MAVQCSILESVCKNLKESPLKVLNGNQIAPSVSYKISSLRRKLCGLNPFGGINSSNAYRGSFLTSPFFSTPYEHALETAWKFYATVDDVYTDGASSYTAQSTISGSGNQPSVSGYPASFDGSGNPVGTGTIWGAVPAITNGSVGLDSSTTLDVASWGSGKLVQTLSDEIDFSSEYATAVSDFFAIPFDWSVSAFGRIYDSFGNYAASGNNISGLTFDNSLDSISPSASPLWSMCCGWILIGGEMQLFSGLAKNNSSTDQNYFIGRRRITGALSRTVPGSSPTLYNYPSGITYTTQILEVISTGVIKAGKVIGYNQTAVDADNIDIPFPSVGPFPLIDLNNAPQIQDLYFAVIGIDTASWGGTNWGTQTAVT